MLDSKCLLHTVPFLVYTSHVCHTSEASTTFAAISLVHYSEVSGKCFQEVCGHSESSHCCVHIYTGGISHRLSRRNNDDEIRVNTRSRTKFSSNGPLCTEQAHH